MTVREPPPEFNPGGGSLLKRVTGAGDALEWMKYTRICRSS